MRYFSKPAYQVQAQSGCLSSTPRCLAVNYPLIPITLLLARTPLIDSLLPFIPLTHALTATAPPLFRSASALPDPLGLDSLALAWPPSPTLTVCALPWLRLGYLHLRRRAFAFVLGAKHAPAEGLVGFLAGLIGPVRDAALAEEDRPAGGAGFAGFDAEVDVDVVQEGEGRREEGGGVEGMAGPAPAPVRAGRLRIGMGRFTSVAVGALVAPILARGAGAALLWLATRRGGGSVVQGWLQKVLGLSAVVAASKAGAGLPWAKFASGMRVAPVDPVWVRNLIGGEQGLRHPTVTPPPPRESDTAVADFCLFIALVYNRWTASGRA